MFSGFLKTAEGSQIVLIHSAGIGVTHRYFMKQIQFLRKMTEICLVNFNVFQ